MTIRHPARINMTGLQEGMAAAGLDLLIAASLENFFYVADAWLLSQRLIPERLCFAILFRDEDPGIVACYSEEKQLRTESWISDIRIYLEHRTSPVQSLAQYLQERGGHTARIGIEKRFLAVAWHEALAAQLPAATLVDGDPVFDAARAVKTEAECARLTQAGLDTEQAILATFQAAQPGDTEKQLADDLATRILQQGSSSFWLTLAAGSNTAFNHPLPGPKRLCPGEILRVDAGGLFAGYQSDVARTAAVGHVTAEQHSVYRSLWEAERETIATLRPGTPARDVYLAAQKALARRGLALTSQAIGHSLGIGLHEHPILHACASSELVPGMMLNIEPAVRDSQGFLYHLEDLVLVTEREPVILTTGMYTEELFVIGEE